MSSYDASQVRAWIEDDPDKSTAAELHDLLARAESGDTNAGDELTDRFSGLLHFGTAGLRGRLGGGPHRMNRAVVIRAAAGLTSFLRDYVGEGFSVVIGYDARHGSYQFAIDTASVIVGAGGHAFLLPSPLPTPITAFAIRHLECDAAVMVTASHNPASDNGYKVYLGGRVVADSGQGAQIIPPFDSQIFDAICAVPSVASVPRPQSGWRILGYSIVDAYIDRVISCTTKGSRDLKIVTTALHGVGAETLLKVLHGAGFTDVHSVKEQEQPDPDFPTITFPNPEEEGTLSLAFTLARKIEADIVIANDPDADRCAIAVPDAAAEGGWRQLSGDQVGSLLGLQAARKYGVQPQTGAIPIVTTTDAETHPDDPAQPMFLASSIVSSTLLEDIAHFYGLKHRKTLTGFKWISRVKNLVYGYEEALGYCVDPEAVRDKDGISAALKVVEMAARQKEKGATVISILDELAIEFGLHATSPLTLRMDSSSLIEKSLENLRRSCVLSLGGSPVTRRIDLAQGGLGLPPTNGLMFTTADRGRVIIRPSGTESKLKCYCEVVIPVSNADVYSAQKAANDKLELIKAQLKDYLTFV